MASKIIRVEPDVANGDLSGMRLNGGVSLDNPVVLKQVEESRFTSVVQAQEDDVGIFLEESEPLEGTFKEIDDKHLI